MSPERPSDAVSSQSLGSFIKEYGKNGSNGDLGRMLGRVRAQFGSDLSLSSKALKMITELRKMEELDDTEKARLFEVLTSGQGRLNNLTTTFRSEWAQFRRLETKAKNR